MQKGVKTVGFLSSNGKVYKKSGNAKKATKKTNKLRELNKIKNRASRNGWKLSKLK